MHISQLATLTVSLLGTLVFVSQPVVGQLATKESTVPTTIGSVRAVSPAVVYSPTAMPDRIVLGWSGDPRTTQSVNWRTSVEVVKGLAEVVQAEAGPYFPEKATQVSATSEALKTDLSTAHYHSATFKNLLPGTVYAYRVGDGTNWSEWFQFRTATANDEPFSFIYFGDAQNDVRSKWSRVIREAYRDAPKAAFMLHAGDLINTAEVDMEWGEWFGAGAWLNAMIPSIAVPGNHEMAKIENGTRRLSHHWKPSFTQPTNGPVGLDESCFSLTYHNMLIVGLNSNERQAEQAAWLDKLLAANKSQWVVCSFHHPIYSTGKDRDNAELRALWKPIFDKHKVDLVLTGHDHTYGRTGFLVPPVTAEALEKLTRQNGGNLFTVSARVGDENVPVGVQKVDPQTGTVYVVSVSGPKMYNHNRQDFMQRVAEDTQLYQIVHIDGGKLRFEARTAIGELYDAFELRKRDGQVNELIEIDPDVPQRLRPDGSKESK
jgi:acid phosphatase type 7